MESVALSSVTDMYSNYELDTDVLALSEEDVTLMGQPLYGRAKETKELLGSYQQLLATREPQTAIVHGVSGCGKTVLVDTLREPVINSNGYFVAGKHSQRNGTVQEPYSAIMAAFSDLCDLVIQSDDFQHGERRQDIALALGSDALLLIKSISNLSPLVGRDEQVLRGEEQQVEQQQVEAAASSSFAKFKAACKTFLRAMASRRHPIVIFLDDIQWADEGSVQLIHMLLQGVENVMLILAYRDEESAAVHHEQTGSLVAATLIPDRITNIGLSNLDHSGVHEIVESIIGSSEEGDRHQIKLLIDLVARRTHGNPLHAIMFMETIQQERLLVYDNTACHWIFNVDEIQQAIMVSETLAELLTRKIERSPDKLKEILKIASLLGYQFGESILLQVVSETLINNSSRTSNNAVSEESPQSLISLLLSGAVKEGFIEKISEGYQFAHDKIQSAFRSLIDADEEKQLHRLIGEAFLTHEDEDKSNIYRAAVHLNSAPEFLCDNHQRARLAQINLMAAKYCIEISAFDRAAVALENALDVLDSEERWSQDYQYMTFEIMEALARTQLIVGDYAACKNTTKEALRHNSRAVNKDVNFLLIEVEVHMVGNEIDAAIAIAKKALNVLGVRIPRKVGLRHVVAKLVAVKFMLRRKTNEQLLNLPMAHDSLGMHAVKLLMHICTYCLLNDETNMSILSALLATELTLKNGLSQYSPCAFAIYGVAEVSIGNIDRAYRFGKLALAMLDGMESREAECSTAAVAFTLLASKKERLYDLVSPLRQVARAGFQRGEIFATFCAGQCFSMNAYIGSNLGELEEVMQRSYTSFCNMGQDVQLGWLQPSFQYVLNMQADVADWDNIAILSGEIMNEDEYLNQALDSNHMALALVCLLWKAKLAVEFGHFALAVSTFERCTSYGSEGVRVAWSAPGNYFDQALAHLGMFEQSGHRRHLREARKYKRLLQRIHSYGCPNASPYLAFLVAREITLGRKPVEVSALHASYRHGIALLVEAKYPNLEAMLNERAGFEFVKRGLQAHAVNYFDRALYIYQYEWGAIAKYNQLKQTSTEALGVLIDDSMVNNLEIHGRSISVPSTGLTIHTEQKGSAS